MYMIMYVWVKNDKEDYFFCTLTRAVHPPCTPHPMHTDKHDNSKLRTICA